MSNAVQDAINRGSAEQRERAQQVIDEARRTIQLISVRSEEDISSTDASAMTRQAQIIEEAKRTIPGETMKDVDEISSPMATPPSKSVTNSNVIEISEHTKSRIEEIEKNGGNNYLNDNAVNRAINKETQDMERQEHEQQRAAGR